MFFIGKILSFGIGVYAGVYIDQNYKVPRVDDPTKIWEDIQQWAEQYKKK